jgi:hypothetical protein
MRQKERTGIERATSEPPHLKEKGWENWHPLSQDENSACIFFEPHL